MTSTFDSYSSDNKLNKEQEPEPLSKKELNGWYLTTVAVCIFIITDERIKVILHIFKSLCMYSMFGHVTVSFIHTYIYI